MKKYTLLKLVVVTVLVIQFLNIFITEQEYILALFVAYMSVVYLLNYKKRAVQCYWEIDQPYTRRKAFFLNRQLWLKWELVNCLISLPVFIYFLYRMVLISEIGQAPPMLYFMVFFSLYTILKSMYRVYYRLNHSYKEETERVGSFIDLDIDEKTVIACYYEATKDVPQDLAIAVTSSRFMRLRKQDGIWIVTHEFELANIKSILVRKDKKSETITVKTKANETDELLLYCRDMKQYENFDEVTYRLFQQLNQLKK